MRVILSPIFQHRPPFLNSWIILFSVLFVISCSPTRRLPDNEYLLSKSKTVVDSREINVADLVPYEKQNPNKTILGLKFHLFLYNIYAPDKKTGFPGWLKKIGEEPVIWDPVLTQRTTEQYRQYLENKGFYDAEVTDTVVLDKKRAITYYSIKLNEPYRIKHIIYHFEDQDLAGFVFADTANCLIKKGGRFDKEVLQNERLRLENVLKNQGFYKFSKEYIFFDAFEGSLPKQIDLHITFKENVAGIPDPVTKVKHHDRYKIDRTYIYPNFTLFSAETADSLKYDTVKIDGNNIIYYGKHRLKPDIALFPNQCAPGSIYRLDKVKKSYNSYSSLGLFRLINIQFRDQPRELPDSNGFKSLDCIIELTPRKTQSYLYEIVGTNSAGDLGAQANLSFYNYNLFHGAEKLEVRLSGAIERISKNEIITTSQNKYTGGIETNLTLPKMLVPFRTEEFTRKFHPQSSILTSYNYQNQPGKYVRTSANTSLSYRWKGNMYNTHTVFPVDFNYIWVPKIDSSYKSNLEPSQKPSFTNHTILATRYVFEYSTQVIEKKEDFYSLRMSLESAGNIIYWINTLTPSANDTSFLNVPNFRYLKTDFDFRIHHQITLGNKIVYRIYAGLGYPLGNVKAMPTEKMYSPGGPNDVRAWSFYELGPGSDTTKAIANENNKLGDIKLVANLEYRFKLFWVMEGALFVDAGNTWKIYEPKEQPGSAFKWDSFYKELGVGTGIGTRFDFSFLLIRVDFGIKMRDPSIQSGSRWIDLNKSVDMKFFPNFRQPELKTRMNIQFGIGYPF
jgi:outer membrane protein assembly factor BamA